MKKLYIIVPAVLAVVAAGLALGSCAAKKQEKARKCLVLYYSQTGNTKAVAEEIARRMNADIEAIEAVEPYEGSYDATIERCRKEMADSVVPATKPLKADIASYDVVFLGFPVWFGTYARPVMDVVAKNKFEGKKVVPFCTFGSGGLESSAAELRAALPGAEILPGYGVREARIKSMPAEVERFLIEGGFVEGSIDPLPDFSEAVAVAEADSAVFAAACSGYKYPLGTPATVARRALPDGSTGYKFTAKSKDRDGADVVATIYIVAPKDGKPEFTSVVRQ